MPQAKTERNLFIARTYSKALRNGQELADRFGVTRGRVYQIVKEYAPERKKQMAGKTARLPVTMIEPEKLDALKAIAQSFGGMALAVLIRWGVDAMLAEHGHRIIKDPEEKETNEQATE